MCLCVIFQLCSLRVVGLWSEVSGETYKQNAKTGFWDSFRECTEKNIPIIFLRIWTAYRLSPHAALINAGPRNRIPNMRWFSSQGFANKDFWKTRWKKFQKLNFWGVISHCYFIDCVCVFFAAEHIHIPPCMDDNRSAPHTLPQATEGWRGRSWVDGCRRRPHPPGCWGESVLFVSLSQQFPSNPPPSPFHSSWK